MATKREILKKMGLTDEQVEQALSEFASLPAGQRPFGCSVSKKGAVSVYGVRTRFPITLYGSEWQVILAHAEEIAAFIEDNRDSLSWREDS